MSSTPRSLIVITVQTYSINPASNDPCCESMGTVHFSVHNQRNLATRDEPRYVPRDHPGVRYQLMEYDQLRRSSRSEQPAVAYATQAQLLR